MTSFKRSGKEGATNCSADGRILIDPRADALANQGTAGNLKVQLHDRYNDKKLSYDFYLKGDCCEIQVGYYNFWRCNLSKISRFF